MAKAKAYVQALEETWQSASDETRAQIDAILQAQGLSATGLADDPQIVINFGIRALTLANVRDALASAADENDPNEREAAVQAFLEKERRAADIIDCRIDSCPQAEPLPTP